MGNGINWKGQVFPKMNNFTAHNRMTGVGNALKRHYKMYLQEYEQVFAQAANARLLLCRCPQSAPGLNTKD